MEKSKQDDLLNFELREPQDSVEVDREDEKKTLVEEVTKETSNSEKAYKDIVVGDTKYDEEQVWHEEDTVEVQQVSSAKEVLNVYEIQQEDSYQEVVVIEPLNYREGKEEKKKEKKKDTSFRTFTSKQQAGEKKWRQDVWAKVKKILTTLLAIVVGIPLAGGLALVGIVGFGALMVVCLAGILAGIAGVGVSFFLASAELTVFGPLVFFVSLLVMGVGLLGSLLSGKVMGYFRNKVRQIWQSMKKKTVQEEV